MDFLCSASGYDNDNGIKFSSSFPSKSSRRIRWDDDSHHHHNNNYER
jgi:hypothetical protein